MAIMIFSLLCNILLDWLFIAVFAWGMRGAALATVTAQGLRRWPHCCACL
ncbi:MAG: hypothetical protein ACLRRT_07320 [Ruthenibacterium lactatiformans]